MRSRKIRPFLNRILGAHRQIASRTNRFQIRQLSDPSLTLWNIMTDMEVERSHHILAPGNHTFVVECTTCMGDPYLFS